MITFINKIRTLLFSPKSNLELILRTAYHKLLESKFSFSIENFLADLSFKRFRKCLRKSSPPTNQNTAPQSKVTFLIAWQTPEINNLVKTIQSIKNLQGSNWEIIIILTDIEQQPISMLLNDVRIKLIITSADDITNQISGEYLIFCVPGDVFSNQLLTYFYHSLLSTNSPDLTYYDSEFFNEEIKKVRPLFKPTTISPALLYSINYLSRGFIKRDIFEKYWPKINKNLDLLNQEYELCFRLYEAGKTIHHIPTVLLSQMSPDKLGLENKEKVITDHLKRSGLSGIQVYHNSLTPHLRWNYDSLSLAIIILSRNNQRFLKTLIPSLKNQNFNGHSVIYIVDNNSQDPETLQFYEKIKSEPNISIIPYPKPFNYSEAINLGVANSNSDLVLLMNDDMDIVDENCVNELAQWATRPEIGIVGAKLLRRNRTLQHVGIVVGLVDYVGHIYLNAPENYHGLFGSANWYRNYLAMTGACQMIRREVFNQVGGYDEAYALAFGDVEFCIRVHNRGYQNVYNPYARLYHYEGSTRGYQTPVSDILKGYQIIDSFLAEGDPFYSPNLTYTRIPKCVSNNFSMAKRRKQIETRRRFYLKHM